MEIKIPSSVTTIGPEAFRNCGSLKKVTFQEESGLEKIQYLCFGSAGLEEISIPKSVTCIEDCAFSDCQKLRKISFQDGSLLEKIGNRCFSGSGIEEFRAPPALRSIGNEAFILRKYLKLAILNEGLERLVMESVYYD